MHAFTRSTTRSFTKSSILVDTIHPENLFKSIKEVGIKGLAGFKSGEYEAGVYWLSRAFVNNKPELLGVSLALESNGVFTRYQKYG